MGIVNGVFALLVLLSFLAFIIGMIKPKFLKLKGRKHVALVTISAFIISTVIFSLTQSEEQKAQMQAEIDNNDKERALKEKENAEKEATAKMVEQKEQQDKVNAKKNAELDTLKKKINFTNEKGTEVLASEIIPVLADISSSIDKTELSHNSLDIYLKAKPVWNEKQVVFDGGMKGAEIISKLKEHGITSLQFVRIHAAAELLDKYDNKSNSEILNIEYDFPEVLKLNSDSYVLYQPYLRFAKMKITHPVGRKAFSDWCQDESNISLSGSFCVN